MNGANPFAFTSGRGVVELLCFRFWLVTEMAYMASKESGPGLGLVRPRGCGAGNKSSNPANRVIGRVRHGPAGI